MSVDSVDYTSMIAGDVDEEVAEKVRKTRREKKHNKLCGCGGGLTRSNYRAILKNSAPVSEAMKKEKEEAAKAKEKAKKGKSHKHHHHKKDSSDSESEESSEDEKPKKKAKKSKKESSSDSSSSD